MSCVAHGCEDLVAAQVVGLLDNLDIVSGADGADHGGNVDAGPGDAGLPESDTGVHRDPWVDLRGDSPPWLDLEMAGSFVVSATRPVFVSSNGDVWFEDYLPTADCADSTCPRHFLGFHFAADDTDPSAGP